MTNTSKEIDSKLSKENLPSKCNKNGTLRRLSIKSFYQRAYAGNKEKACREEIREFAPTHLRKNRFQLGRHKRRTYINSREKRALAIYMYIYPCKRVE